MATRIAIVGPTGYTGLHLIQILLRHPQAELTYLASRRDVLPDITEVFPRLRGWISQSVAVCRPIDARAIAREADVVFVALPHQAAMSHVPSLLEAGLRVVDLSADYRLADAARYEAVYQTSHTDTKHLALAVYGLPELFRDQIRDAALVANPGCYPTAAGLAMAPLIKAGAIRLDGIIINAASGVTGAGKKPAPHLHFPERNESFAPYGQIGGHRHQPEIEQTLSTVAGSDVSVLFIPHLLPINRGILETIYLHPTDPQVSTEQLNAILDQAYQDEPFVRVVDGLPDVKHVVDTNFCDLMVRVVRGANRPMVVVFGVVDNMIKGASGQAVQNMNLMFGHDQTLGLTSFTV